MLTTLKKFIMERMQPKLSDHKVFSILGTMTFPVSDDLLIAAHQSFAPETDLSDFLESYRDFANVYPGWKSREALQVPFNKSSYYS